MKINRNFKLLLLVFLSAIMMKCQKSEVTDFGFNGSLKGIVKDMNGSPIYSDINSNNLVINLLGDGDQQVVQIRVNGDGTFNNAAIFPKKHKVWLEGPIIPIDPITIDFSTDLNKVNDFKVTPFISPKVTKGSVNGTSINVEYSIIVNAGKTIQQSEIYCSTVKYPTSSTGSNGKNWMTKTVPLSTLNGNVSIDGLEKGKYYVRIGALSNGSTLMNYSNQIEINIP